MKINRDQVFLLWNLVIPIVIGAALYYLFLPEVIFVQQIDKILGHGLHMEYVPGNSFFIRLIRNYFMDMLWGYALIFPVFYIMDSNAAGLNKVFIMVFIFSAIMELLQLTSFVQGTFDIWDIFMEALAEMAAVFIIRKHYSGGKKEV